MNVPDFIKKMDWELLFHQKSTLFELSLSTGDEKVANHLSGVVYLIDAIQKSAVSFYNLSNSTVFPELRK